MRDSSQLSDLLGDRPLILAEFDWGIANPAPPRSLERRRFDRELPDSAALEALIQSARRSSDPEKRALALGLARQLARQADDLQALEQLRESGSQFRAIVESLLTALITIDEKGRILAVNPAAERMYGYAADELVGRSVSLLMPFDSHENALSMLCQTYFGRHSPTLELQGRRKNGQIFPCELMMFEIAGNRGRSFTGNIRDLTDKKAVERLQTDLVSIVSHELRTPLTSIRGSLSLIGTGIFGAIPEEAAELVGIAERNCNRLIDLVSDMLDLERLDNGELEMEMAPTPLAEVIARSLDGVRGFAAERRIRLEVGTTAGAVWAHGPRLVQVLVNLLANAIKFSPEGEVVKVSAFERRRVCEVRVEDHGRGIPSHLPAFDFRAFRPGRNLGRAGEGRHRPGTRDLQIDRRQTLRAYRRRKRRRPRQRVFSGFRKRRPAPEQSLVINQGNRIHESPDRRRRKRRPPDRQAQPDPHRRHGGGRGHQRLRLPRNAWPRSIPTSSCST